MGFPALFYYFIRCGTFFRGYSQRAVCKPVWRAFFPHLILLSQTFSMNRLILLAIIFTGGLFGGLQGQDIALPQAVELRAEDSLPKAVRSENTSKNAAQGPLTGCVEACVGACVGIGCSAGSNFLFSGLWRYHHEMVESKPDVPRVVSLDVMAQGGADPGRSITFAPRIRGTFGFFSTDFRLIKTDIDQPGYISSYSTIDWQILVFNLLNIREANLRMGTGLMYLRPEFRWLSEGTVALDLYFLDESLSFQTEGRFASDFNGDPPARWELNAGFNVRFLYGSHLWGYATLGGLYQEYSGTPVRALFGGLRFNLH